MPDISDQKNSLVLGKDLEKIKAENCQTAN